MAINRFRWSRRLTGGLRTTIPLLVLHILWPVQARAQRSSADSAAVLVQEAVRAYQQGSRPALERSIRWFQQALPQLRRANNRRGEHHVLSSIAAIYHSMGRADSALVYVLQALPIADELGDRASLGADLSNLASVYQALGRLDSALVYDERAIPLLREVGARREEAAALANIGVVHHDMGQPDSALAILARARSLAAQASDPEAESATLTDMGMVYLSMHRADSALAYLGDALDVAKRSGNRRLQGNTLLNVGFTYGLLHRPDTALANLAQALDLTREVGERRGEGAVLGIIGLVHQQLHHTGTALAYYEQALAIHREVGNRASEGATLGYVASLYFGDPSRSQRELARAVAYYDSSAAVIAEIGRSVAGDPNLLSFDEQDAGLFPEWALAWLARAPEVGMPDAAASALAASERGRAQALRELMRSEASGSSAAAGAGAARIRPGADLAAEGRALAASVSRTGVPGLSYLVTPDTLLTFLVLPGREVEVIRTAVRDDTLAALVTRLRAALRSDAADWRTSAARLSTLLLPAGVRARLPGSGGLAIIPSGPLFLLPFAALPLSAEAAQTPDSTSFFGLRYAIRYAPSLQVLADVEARPGHASPTTDALVVGDPAMPQVPDEDGRLFVPSSLPGAREEGRWVAEHTGSSVLTGSAATEAVVRSRLGAATLVHLATHAQTFANDARARSSYIALAPGEGQDGRLTVAEVLDELPEMRAELVVLSACQTGLGDLKQAEGTVGLQRAFLARGARGVLVSLWSVRDAAASLLMQHFYTYWLGGDARAEALRKAQMDVAGDPRFRHPRYWAAFQMVGAR